MRRTVHSQEGQITLESTVNWMEGCRRRINTESSVARPWVRGGTWDGDSCIHSRKVTYWEGGDQCSASAPGSWPAGLHMARGKSEIRVRFQQIASEIIERC